MKVLIFGGTGFIGKQLVHVLVDQGYELLLFTRNPESASKSFNDKVKIIGWNSYSGKELEPYFKGEYAIINLAGESIGSKFWTKKQKAKILSSRLLVTKAITECIQKAAQKPVVMLQGSAIGYYGSRSETILNEDSTKGIGFLSDVVDDWEKQARTLDVLNSRVVIFRSGIVLGKQGGILPLMLLPFRFYLGGYPGNGKQWLSWIHISDIVKAIVFLLQSKTASGIYNLTSFEPVQMKLFARTAGQIIGKPAWFAIPALGFKVLLPGGMAEDLVLISQRVFPDRLLKEGFQFDFADINRALENILLK